MMPFLRRASTWLLVGLVIATALVVQLALDLRKARREYAALRARSSFLTPGMYAPQLDLPLAAGGRATIGAPAEGTAQVLFLYTTTCDFCRANMPLWRDLSRRLRDMAVQVYGVSLDSAAVTQRFAIDDSLEFPSALLSDTRSAGLLRAFAVPQTLVVGSDGRVLYSRRGVLTGAAIDSVIAASTSEASRGR